MIRPQCSEETPHGADLPSNHPAGRRTSASLVCAPLADIRRRCRTHIPFGIVPVSLWGRVLVVDRGPAFGDEPGRRRVFHPAAQDGLAACDSRITRVLFISNDHRLEVTRSLDDLAASLDPAYGLQNNITRSLPKSPCMTGDAPARASAFAPRGWGCRSKTSNFLCEQHRRTSPSLASCAWMRPGRRSRFPPIFLREFSSSHPIIAHRRRFQTARPSPASSLRRKAGGSSSSYTPTRKRRIGVPRPPIAGRLLLGRSRRTW